jgi:hypothetical protein
MFLGQEVAHHAVEVFGEDAEVEAIDLDVDFVRGGELVDRAGGGVVDRDLFAGLPVHALLVELG